VNILRGTNQNLVDEGQIKKKQQNGKGWKRKKQRINKNLDL